MKLKPCPFCGNKKRLIIENDPKEDSGLGTWWFVTCDECTVFGPYKNSETGAIEKWNNRPLEDKDET